MKGFFAGISHNADHLDTFTVVLTLICGLVALAVFVSIVYFSWRFHASRGHPKGSNFQSYKIEVIWTLATLIIFMGIFAWATIIYRKQVTPFEKADYEIFVYGKRWMWKVYHSTGIGEVNMLHLPRGKKVRLVMLSKDVIHSFFIPDLRIKQDVLPETYTYLHIEPMKNGKYNVYCTEYCGSYHSKMLAEAEVLEESAYRNFIGLRDELSTKGEELFKKYSCNSCHFEGSVSAPDLGIVTKTRDDNFIRQSILYPNQYVEKGYEPIMPSFKDTVSEEEIRSLTHYIRSLGAK